MATKLKLLGCKCSAKGARATSLITIVVLLCCSLAAFGKTDNRLRKKTDLGVGVEVTSGLHQFHSTCMLFQVFFISGDFFNGLQERRTPNGLEFMKGHTTYQSFPDLLVVDVQITIFKCPPSNPDQTYPFGYGEGLLAEPAFELKWKGPSGDLRPVTLLSAREQHLIIGVRWDYFLALSSKDVPLTDVLVGDISLRKGTTHIQFSAGLAQ
jgi:hypothetical protein